MRWGISPQYEVVQYLSLDATTVSLPDKPLGKEFDLFHDTQHRAPSTCRTGSSTRGSSPAWASATTTGSPATRWSGSTTTGERTDRPSTTRRVASGNRHPHALRPPLQGAPLPAHRGQPPDHRERTTSSSTTATSPSARPTSTSTPRPVRSLGGGVPAHRQSEPEPGDLGAVRAGRRHTSSAATWRSRSRCSTRTSTTIRPAPRSSPDGPDHHAAATSSSTSTVDYARSRGIELELRKHKAGSRISWNASYTYSLVKGKSSDPNNLSPRPGHRRRRPRDEPGRGVHVVEPAPQADGVVSLPRRSRHGLPHPRCACRPTGASISTSWSSPVGPTRRSTSSATRSVRLLEERAHGVELNGNLTKGFRLIGPNIERTCEGCNLLDDRTPLDLRPGHRQALGAGQGDPLLALPESGQPESLG